MSLLERANTYATAELSKIPEPPLAVWSKPFWTTLYFAARKFPDVPTTEQRINMKTFMFSISKVLPCDECSTHFDDELKDAGDVIFSNKTTLFLFLFDTYNNIRVKYGGKAFTFEESVSAIKSMASGIQPSSQVKAMPSEYKNDRKISEYAATGIVSFGAGIALGLGISVHETRRRSRRA
jgi:hypothetical protein